MNRGWAEGVKGPEVADGMGDTKITDCYHRKRSLQRPGNLGSELPGLLSAENPAAKKFNSDKADEGGGDGNGKISKGENV